MTVVYTARYNYAGPDRVDITTRKTHFTGKVFAPDWKTMVEPFKQGVITFAQYTRLYDYYILGTVPDWAWDWVKNQLEITLVCFCPDPTICHRSLVANYLSTYVGCRYAGERKGRW